MPHNPKMLVAGVGMTPYVKPGKSDYPDLAELAIRRALSDSGLTYKDIESGVCG
jgi:hypothetical protein